VRVEFAAVLVGMLVESLLRTVFLSSLIGRNWEMLELDLLLVDNHGHSVLAMLSLRAVQPHWGGVLDHDGVCWGGG